MVNSISNISTLLSSGDDLLKGSNRESYSGGSEAAAETQTSVRFEDQSSQDVSGSLQNFAEELSQYVDDPNLSLEFSKDTETEQMIMRLVNGDTREVVKQFPPEISLKIARILSQQSNGSLADAKV
jgi:uncharacterized FlaG/YvyC family protein